MKTCACSLAGSEICKNCQVVTDYSKINSINNYNYYFDVKIDKYIKNNKDDVDNTNEEKAEKILNDFNKNFGGNYGW